MLWLLFAGCASPGQFVWIDSLAPAQQTLTQDTYIIGTDDMLTVQVFNHPEMSGSVRVRTDGKVSVGLLGDVPAAGRAPAVLAREIEQNLAEKNLVVAARVTVALDEAAPIGVSILGEVARPGQYSLSAGSGLYEALATSGGFTDFAHRDRLFILRRTPELVRIRFTYDDLSRGKGFAAFFRLRSGDTIVIE